MASQPAHGTPERGPGDEETTTAPTAIVRAEPDTDGTPGAIVEHEMLRTLALGQALYYALTGVWSLVSIRTFQKVTGPKTDLWLVKTVGVLVTVIGGVLGLAAWRDRLTPEIGVLATGSALGLTGIDVTYTAKGRISPIYLADAVSELVLVAAWLVLWMRADARRDARRVA